MAKPVVAFNWSCSCGGCEEAVVDLHEGILDVVKAVEIVFWPVAMDFKYTDIEARPDKSIDVAFLNGSIRTSEQDHIAHLFRRKSKVVIAFGACACLGGIMGLGNLHDRKSIFENSYGTRPSLDNAAGTVPKTETTTDGVTVTLPEFYDTVKTLDQTVDVDYYLPGCPPMPETISDALGAILSGKLPPKGAVLSPGKALCDTCERKATKPERAEVAMYRRPHETMIDPDKCFLAQGLVCVGPATRSGCGTKCINVNMPCRGCYGPPNDVEDQGMAALAGISSILTAMDEKSASEAGGSIADPIGTFYRFSLPSSTLRRRRITEVR